MLTMNNFIKYPSASNIDVAEMFSKDNLVSITGLKDTGKALTELSVLNKDNNFNNEDKPTEMPDFFEIKFKDISIMMDINYPYNELIINRNIVIERTKIDDTYNFNLINIKDEEDILIGSYYTLPN